MVKPFPPGSMSGNWPWFPREEMSPAEGVCPKISIVTPSFNQGRYLEETIRSVLLQGYPNLEYIVIDGGSTDESVEIIKKYEPWLSYWVSEADSGQSEAINKGFSMATGDWFGWLNSDDLYMPGALLSLAGAVNSENNLDWVVGMTTLGDENCRGIGEFRPRFDASCWQQAVCMRNAEGMALPQPSSFWSKEAWRAAGPLDTSLNYAMDYDFWCHLARCGFRPFLVQESWATFRQHVGAKTTGGGLKFLHEEQEIVKRWIRLDPCEDLISYYDGLSRKIRKLKKDMFVESFFNKVLKFIGAGDK